MFFPNLVAKRILITEPFASDVCAWGFKILSQLDVMKQDLEEFWWVAGDSYMQQQQRPPPLRAHVPVLWAVNAL